MGHESNFYIAQAGRSRCSPGTRRAPRRGGNNVAQAARIIATIPLIVIPIGIPLASRAGPAVLREAGIQVVELETTVHHPTDQLESWSERSLA